MLTAEQMWNSAQIDWNYRAPPCRSEEYSLHYCKESNRYRDERTGRYVGVKLKTIPIYKSKLLRFLVQKGLVESI